ncbi:hypothetical protein JXB28_03150 [Candidatus Woesearchaeota archaeon]|nr:hypothetical protein [Candidatus Woesearchaeota archaeon]
MDFTSILFIVVGAVIIYFAAKFLAHGVKLAVKLLVLSILVLAFLSFMVYKDVEDLKEGFQNYNNTFFIYNNETLHAGVVLKPLDSLILTTDSFSFFSEEEMEALAKDFQEGNYKGMMGNSHKLFFFNPSVLQKPFKQDIGVELDEDDMLNIIKSDEPFDVLARKVRPEQDETSGMVVATLKELYGSEQKLKGVLFAALIGNYFQQQKPGELVKNIKSKELMVYPEGISFKIIRYMPWID